jgi:predicted SnoaL-like aldol condensation-catalyzing enzyme
MRMAVASFMMAALFATPPLSARPPAETATIVLKFTPVFRGAFSRAELAGMLADDFIEHHPTALDASPERTKDEFINHFSGPRPSPAGSAPKAPPTPVVAMSTEDYVLLMTKRDTPYMRDPTRTYEAFTFDLYRVDAAGKIAEHWDSFKADGGLPPSAK